MNNDLIKSLRKKIRTRDNAPTVDAMRKLGINYRINHGVSYSEIKTIAEQFKYNHELAVELWKHNNREFKIIATLIENPETVEFSQINEWVESLENTELAEQISINLLWRIKDIKKYIISWLDSDNEYTKKAAFVLIAQLAMRDKTIPDDDFIQYFDFIEKNSNTENIFLRKSISLALRKIGRRNKKLNKNSIELAKKIEQTNSNSAKWIAHDVLLEITDEIIKNTLK